MASSGRRGGGDRVLESRHLVGLFLGVVLLCAVFFTLGYVMGRTQFGGPVHAAGSLDHGAPLPMTPVAKPKDDQSAQNPATPAPGEWDFYTKKDDTHLGPDAANASPASAPVAASKAPTAGRAPSAVLKPVSATPAANAPSRFAPPKSMKGAIVLQIAALNHESDALAMADILQRKKFPSFVVAPTSDSFYRVQVGPYPNEHAAESAQSALERDGFKALIKR
jgi:DedD protein